MIPTKKLVNSAETCVDDSIEGFVALHPGVRQLTGQPRVVVRADIDDFRRRGKVVTVTGGGSGHEPCFMGTHYGVIFDCHSFINIATLVHTPVQVLFIRSALIPQITADYRRSPQITADHQIAYFYAL